MVSGAIFAGLTRRRACSRTHPQLDRRLRRLALLFAGLALYRDAVMNPRASPAACARNGWASSARRSRPPRPGVSPRSLRGPGRRGRDPAGHPKRSMSDEQDSHDARGQPDRPAELLPSCRAVSAGSPTTPASSMRAGARRDRRVRTPGRRRHRPRQRRRVRASSSWITYLYERVRGSSRGMMPVEGARHPADLVRDRARISGVLRRGARCSPPGREPDPPRTSGAPEEPSPRDGAGGPMWVCTGPIATTRPAHDVQLAILRSALEGLDVADAFLAGRRPGERVLDPQRALRHRGGVRLRRRRRAARGVPRRSSTRGSCCRSTTPCCGTSSTRSVSRGGSPRLPRAGPSCASTR